GQMFAQTEPPQSLEITGAPRDPALSPFRAGFSYSLNHIRKRRYCREPDKGGGRLLLGAKWEGGDEGSGPWPILPPQPTVSITGYVATQFSFTAKAIPLETEASSIPRATDWRDYPQLGNA